MLQYIDKETFFEVYSDEGKVILEKPNNILWNTDKEHPIAISKLRVNDYNEIDELVPEDAFKEDTEEDIVDIE